uniref:Uncharacterized protein n=1 Tax=Physcomitrium patens TaxID=3218 RepID=A0A2K1KFH6_PHYPA|nr:hypothetical protein PHYPA_008883 [Physcomitrium patens]
MLSDHGWRLVTGAFYENSHSNCGLPLGTNAIGMNGQVNHKDDTAENNTLTRSAVEKGCNGQVFKNYGLDLPRHQLRTRMRKSVKWKRLPRRIVSLLPSHTEILLEIGVGDRLITITDMCDMPPGVKSKLPVVCSSKLDIASMSSKSLDFEDTCAQCDMDDCTLTSMLIKAGIVSKNIAKLVTLSPKTIEILRRIPQFWSIPAVKRREVDLCEHSHFSFPGPRLVESVEMLAYILHPGVCMKMIKVAMLKFSLPAGQRCRPEELTYHFHCFQ